MSLFLKQLKANKYTVQPREKNKQQRLSFEDKQHGKQAACYLSPTMQDEFYFLQNGNVQNSSWELQSSVWEPWG